MTISISKMTSGAFFVCADDDRKEQVCRTEEEVDNALSGMGVPSEETAIALGLIDAGTHTTVWFDAYNRAVIEDTYGEILE